MATHDEITKKLYDMHLKTKIVPVNHKVYRSVYDYFKLSKIFGSLYHIAEQHADEHMCEVNKEREKKYLDNLRSGGFFGCLFNKAPEPLSKDFKDGYMAGYVEAAQRDRFLSDNLPKEKLEKLHKFLNDEGISITAVNNELLIQNSKEMGEVIEYKLEIE